eukprot:jgi/Botrbrau1/94/Bobra.0022s0084.1
MDGIGKVPQKVGGLHYATVLWTSRHFYEKELQGKLQSWQLARAVAGENQFLLKLQELINQWNEGTCVWQETPGCQPYRTLYRLQVLDFHTLTFREQIKAASGAAIFAGVHGAAMTYVAYQDTGRSGMMEIITPGAHGNYHYHNLAYWNQVQYRSVSLMGTDYGDSCNAAFSDLLLNVARLNHHGTASSGGT